MKKSLPLALTVVSVAGAVLPAAAAAKTIKYTGATERYKYGVLAVTITVSGKKIAKVDVKYLPSDPRSSQIDSVAMPMLREEALKAQGWNVHAISGASYTSAAFRESLYSAMGHAKLLKK